MLQQWVENRAWRKVLIYQKPESPAEYTNTYYDIHNLRVGMLKKNYRNLAFYQLMYCKRRSYKPANKHFKISQIEWEKSGYL